MRNCLVQISPVNLFERGHHQDADSDQSGADAAKGTALTKVARNAERAKQIATTTEVRPVRPPAPMPAALSTNVVVLEVPIRAPIEVAVASAKSALSNLE